MPKFLINVHEQDDGSLPIDKWDKIEKETIGDAIQIAIDRAMVLEKKDFSLPFMVYVAKGSKLWANGVPICCTQYKIGEV